VYAGAEEVRLRVATPRPALLVLTDLHWPGWRVTVNGEIRSIIRANALFRAIAVEPGAHDVRFVYEPGPAHIGALVSAVTLVLVIAVLARGLRDVARPDARDSAGSSPRSVSGAKRAVLARMPSVP
jgi:uncharacterized membrane protein YfhO